MLTKQQMNDLIYALDAVAREVSSYDYGLPTYDEAQMARLREVIRETLEKNNAGA